MCSHFLWGRGYTFICGGLSREDFPRKPDNAVCLLSNYGFTYQFPRSRGYIFHKIGGSGGEELRAKVPLILRKWGGGERWRTLRQQLWFFRQARLFIDSVFSLIAVFWCDFAIFDFRPCHCSMNVFSHALILRSYLAIILIEEEFFFHMIYDTYHLLS